LSSKRAVSGLALACIVLAAISACQGCSKGPSGDSGRVSLPRGHGSMAITLPPKVFTQIADGSIRITGHWVLRTSEPPLSPGEFPFAAQPLNSTIITCSRSTGTCVEYRAAIVGADGYLLPLDPLESRVLTWDSDRIVAAWSAPAQVECLLRVDRASQEVAMEYRRQPTPGRTRVFERWVLE
jgi:hypothetical protein